MKEVAETSPWQYNSVDFVKQLDEEYPGYGFGIHKGYYTELHKEAVEQQGVTPLHRKSFEPIKSIVRWVKPE